jgi:hypothetical protein
MKDNNGHNDLGLKLKNMMENETGDTEDRFPPTPRPDTETKDGKKDFIIEILEAWKEARTYDDRHLYEDHIGWLKESFSKGWFEFPDDYDFDTQRWSLGLLIAQVERYGGIVIETEKGNLPFTHFPTNIPDEWVDDTKETITES